MKKKKILCIITALCIAVLPSCALKKGKTENEITEFSSFLAAYGTELSEDNTIQKIISEKIGAKCRETWLKEGETAESVISKMIISGEYPDFISPDSTQQQKLLNAGALIPIDEYWDDYPNLKNYFTEAEWDRIRSEDGHVYYVPAFSKVYLYDTTPVHYDEAFWIQVRVLEWAGYPKITTLDDYFDVLERYLAANPTNEDGSKNIGYEILSEDWLYFCLENPPQFLDGYPNDGCCIVNPNTLEAVDFNTTPTAKRWFKKLNEEYKKGVIDPECFLLTADQYFEKLATGNVLGMVDQYWNYSGKIESLPPEKQYVPIGVVIDKDIEEHYHSNVAMDTSSGVGITTSCNDVEAAVKFLNDLLSPEVLNLRFWGIEGVDYSIDENGLFYMTDEQAASTQNNDNVNYSCRYSYFPYYRGMNLDGINAYCWAYQPSVFYSNLDERTMKCLDAYGAQTYVELLNKSEENAAWFPMWSYTNTFTDKTPYGKAKIAMDEVKHEYLPKVVMGEDFDTSWEEYMDAYHSRCDVDVYINELTAEVRRRSNTDK